MNVFIPPSHNLFANFNPASDLVISGDKSLSHRAALFSALAEGESRITNFLNSGVTQVMLQALNDLGVKWVLNENTLTVAGKGLRGFVSPSSPLYCGHSATTIRLLAGALAACDIDVTLVGSDGLNKRPMGRIVEPLQTLGVDIHASPQGTAPLVIKKQAAGKSITGGTIVLQQASAQVKTCVLLAGLSSSQALTIIEPGPSRDHSERMLRAMGACVEVDGLTIRMQPLTNPLIPLSIQLPGDFSAAAFLIVAALITPGSEIVLEGVGLNPRRTGLLDVLIEMGAHITVEVTGETAGEPVGHIHVVHSTLTGTTVQGDVVVRMIDEFPIFAVAAAYAQGETRVKDALELRYKESDRIKELCSQLSAIGVDIVETADGFVIQGRGKVPGGTGESKGDHRLAMSLAVAGLASEHGINVIDADMVTQSFPHFFELLKQMGVKL